MRLKLISCGILEREVHEAVAQSVNQVEVEFLPANLHQLSPGEKLRGLQSFVEAVNRSQAHALLVFCGSQESMPGLQAGPIPLVLPRAQSSIWPVLDRSAGRSESRRSRLVETGRAATEPDAASGRCRTNPSATYWMAPVHNASIKPLGSPTRREPPSNGLIGQPLRRRGELGRLILGRSNRSSRACSRGSPRAVRKPWPERRSISILQQLVDGYWSHSDFLVVPPGWRIATRPGDFGGLIAEESVP